MTIENIILVLVSALISGLFATYVTDLNQKIQQEKQLKLKLASDVFGYRYQLKTSSGIKETEFICALNKVPIIFSNSKEVMDAYTKFLHSSRDDKSTEEENNSTLINLIKRICEDIGINHFYWDDKIIETPFSMKQF